MPLGDALLGKNFMQEAERRIATITAALVPKMEESIREQKETNSLLKETNSLLDEILKELRYARRKK